MSSELLEITKEEDILENSYEALPDHCKRYWKKRYQLWSKFDQGILFTPELWYSVTPEKVAKFTAKLAKVLVPRAKSALDVCCGGGGNTIQFARYFEQSVGIDISSTNITCCEHNARIYGRHKNTHFIRGNWKELQNSLEWVPDAVELYNGKFDVVFSSPPWGGPAVNKQEHFDLNTMKPFNLREIVTSMKKVSDNIFLFIPKNSDLSQIRELTRELYGPKGKARAYQTYENGWPVALLVVFGDTWQVEVKKGSKVESLDQDFKGRYSELFLSNKFGSLQFGTFNALD
ncbi:hypothetical protein CJJ07_001974 [Candidozyma auris]|nr:hypothetical protein CJJ07_001974 [[Candida] auris]QEL60224.1 hypothetical protein CJJ09_002322 [[Candida] auris]